MKDLLRDRDVKGLGAELWRPEFEGDRLTSKSSVSLEIKYIPTWKTLLLFDSILAFIANSGSLIKVEVFIDTERPDIAHQANSIINAIMDRVTLSNSVQELRFQGCVIPRSTFVDMLAHEDVKRRFVSLSLQYCSYAERPGTTHFGQLPFAISGLRNLQELALPSTGCASKLKDRLESAAALTGLHTLKVVLKRRNQALALQTHFIERTAHRDKKVTIVVYDTTLDKAMRLDLANAIRAFGQRRATIVIEDVIWPKEDRLNIAVNNFLLKVKTAPRVTFVFGADCGIREQRKLQLNRECARN